MTPVACKKKCILFANSKTLSEMQVTRETSNIFLTETNCALEICFLKMSVKSANYASWGDQVLKRECADCCG